MRIIAGLCWWMLLTHCASSEPRQAERSEQAIANVRRDLARAPSALQVSTRDGVEVVKVESGFRHATIVTRAADGTRKARCTNEASEAEAMLNGAAE